MKPFLYRVAEAFFGKYEYGISDFSFVFPNRRAGIFFRQHLSAFIKKPLFSPEILTVGELFESGSALKISDRLGNLFRLYKIFIKHAERTESFDNFAFWGEMLLADFDEIDKYRVDTRQLFTNIGDIKKIETLFEYFSPEQKAAIEQFWGNMNNLREGDLLGDFMRLWKAMFPVYEEFSQQLQSFGLATEGMICRNVGDELRAGKNIAEWAGKKFVFIGFNALNPCETTLFKELQKRSQADFYWDYEAAELRDADNPASQKFRENTLKFPSKLEILPDVIPLKDKNINLVAIPSATGQARYVQHILEQIYPENSAENNLLKTAVALPDEALLLPLLGAFPQQISKINITMGYPLKAAPVSALMELVFELWSNRHSENRGFYHRTVGNILNHQYIMQICSVQANKIKDETVKFNKIYLKSSELHSHRLLQTIFDEKVESRNFLPYLLKILSTLDTELNLLKNNELQTDKLVLQSNYIYAYFSVINRMNDLLHGELAEIQMELATLIRLVCRTVATTSMPFEGEPLEGLQVMGMLETRGLDFENLIVTSFNEGVFPKKLPQNSFIPYNLRRGFGLPVYQMHDSVTAYNFYRLVSRAKNIYFLYDSRTEGILTGEASRFALQLKYIYGIEFNKINPVYDFALGETQKIKIPKNAEIMRKLGAYLVDNETAKYLSASSLNDYIDCPLKFYLTHIEGITEMDEVKEDIENDTFGSIFHAAMELIYKRYEGKTLQKEDFKLLENHNFIDFAIKQAFFVKYFKKQADETPPELEGNLLLISKIIRKFIVNLLQIDSAHAPFEYIKSEKKFKTSLKTAVGNVNVKGFIDRVDCKNGVVRIIDYKTGSGNVAYKSMADIFSPSVNNRPKYVLQAFLYGLFYDEKRTSENLMPCFYFVSDLFRKRETSSIRYKPEKNVDIEIADFAEVEGEFIENLKLCLEQIFDPQTPFCQTDNAKTCEYCLHRGICYR